MKMIQDQPYWWEDAGPPALETDIPLPRQVDCLVVGAGLTGLSAGRTLAKSRQSVVVVDSGAPGIGASSRNGGMIGGGHRLPLSSLTEMFGGDLARQLLSEMHIEATEFAVSLIEDEEIDCDYRQTGRFQGFWHKSEFERAKRELDALSSIVPVQAQLVCEPEQHMHVATDIYRGGIFYPRHGGLNPAKWTAGLKRAAIRAGAIIAGQAGVSATRREGSKFVVETQRGTVRTRHILLATNGYTPLHFRRHSRRVVPVPSFIVTTETLGANRAKSMIPGDSMIVETRNRHCYYRLSPDGQRLIFGGRAAMLQVPPVLFGQELKKLLTRIFPELRDVRISHRWMGKTGFSFGQLPNVGQMDGIWHAMGYCGNGNAMAPWLGHKAALAMIGDPEGDTAFLHTGLPTRWWHPGIPWFLPFADAAFRLRDLRDSARL